MRRQPSRLAALLSTACIVVSACSGTTGRSDESTAPAPTAATSTRAETRGAPHADDGNGPPPAETTPLAPHTSTTTTTTVPPRVVPLGVRGSPGDTAIDPTVDLSAVDVWDDSICPDGLPPDDPPIGTCVRAGPEG